MGTELVVGGGTDEGDAVAAAGKLEGKGLPDNLLQEKKISYRFRSNSVSPSFFLVKHCLPYRQMVNQFATLGFRN